MERRILQASHRNCLALSELLREPFVALVQIPSLRLGSGEEDGVTDELAVDLERPERMVLASDHAEQLAKAVAVEHKVERAEVERGRGRESGGNDGGLERTAGELVRVAVDEARVPVGVDLGG